MCHLVSQVAPDCAERTAPHVFDEEGFTNSNMAFTELLTPEELADLERTIGGHGVTEWAAAIDSHPYASGSRKGRFRIALWMWNGVVSFDHHDLLRQDHANRDRVIRAFRVFMGMMPSESPIIIQVPATTGENTHVHS